MNNKKRNRSTPKTTPLDLILYGILSLIIVFLLCGSWVNGNLPQVAESIAKVIMIVGCIAVICTLYQDIQAAFKKENKTINITTAKEDKHEEK